MLLLWGIHTKGKGRAAGKGAGRGMGERGGRGDGPRRWTWWSRRGQMLLNRRFISIVMGSWVMLLSQARRCRLAGNGNMRKDAFTGKTP